MCAGIVCFVGKRYLCFLLCEMKHVCVLLDQVACVGRNMQLYVCTQAFFWGGILEKQRHGFVVSNRISVKGVCSRVAR